MKKRIMMLLLIVTLVVSNLNYSYDIKANEVIENSTQIVVKLDEEATSTVIDELSNELTSEVSLEFLSTDNLGVGESNSGLENYVVITVGANDDLNEVTSVLATNESVEAVDTDDIVYTYSDTTYTAEELGVEGLVGNGLDIGVSSETYNYPQNKEVIIGILDSGIDVQHMDLANAIYVNKNEIPDNGIDDDNNGYIDDTAGWDFINNTNTFLGDDHGTGIAGVIAAEQNNQGIHGVANNVKILPLKFIENGRGSVSDAVEAIAYAESIGVSIMNCSWGSFTENEILKNAMRNSNMLFVCSAGNDGSTRQSYPASFDISNVISVGAVDEDGVRTSSTSYGESVDIFAEGKDVITTSTNNYFARMSGTSVAAAYVSGTLSMINAWFPKSSMMSLKNKLLEIDYVTTEKILNVNKSIESEVEVIDYDEFLSDPDRAQSILASNWSYSDVFESDREFLLNFYDLNHEVMLELETYNFLLGDSVAYCNTISNSDFIHNMVLPYCLVDGRFDYNKFGTVQAFAEFYLKYIGESTNSSILQELQDGTNANLIKGAFIVSTVCDAPISSFVANGDEDIQAINQAMGDNYDVNNLEIFEAIYYLYPCNMTNLMQYCKDNSLSADDFWALICDFEDTIAEQNGEIYLQQSESDQFDYNKYINAPMSYQNHNNEEIGLSNGSLTTSNNLLSLEGINGLDVQLDLVYSSGDSNLYEMEPGSSTSTKYDAFASLRREFWYSKNYHRYGYDTILVYLGQFSSMVAAKSAIDDYQPKEWTAKTFYASHGRVDGYIKLIKNDEGAVKRVSSSKNINKLSDETYTESSMLGSGWSFNMPSIELIDGEKYLHFMSSTYKYQYTESSNDSNLEEYLLTDIVMDEDDTYSNGTNQSTYVVTRSDGREFYFDSQGKVIGQLDRFGNSIKYFYQSFEGKDVLTKIVDSVDREVNISYTTEDVDRKIEVAIGADIKKTIYLSPIDSTNDYSLDSVVDAIGNTTSYKYEIYDSGFNYFSKSLSGLRNKYALLSSVKYSTGGQTVYQYEKYLGNLGKKGVQELYRVKERKEFDGTNTFNTLTYKYSTNNYTGYPECSDPENLSDDFEFNTTITNTNGIESKHFFNDERQLARTEVYDSNSILISENLKEYNEQKLCVMSKQRNHENGVMLERVSEYSYDSKGNVTSFWGPKQERKEDGSRENEEHLISYSYDEHYNILLSKEYKQNENTFIKERSVLTDDNKSVRFFEVDTKNTEDELDYVLQEKTEFIHDDKGNVTEQINHRLEDGTTIHTFFDYSDNVFARNGAFDGCYLTSMKVTGVKDSEGVLVQGTYGTPGEIVEKYFYNNQGLLYESIDGNQNVTKMEFDSLDRVKKIVYPDFSEVEYVFNDIENTLTIENQKNARFKYYYDAFGNETGIEDLQSGSFISSKEYFSDFSVKNVSNNLADNGYIKTYKYYDDGRVEEVMTHDQDNALLAHQTFSYLDAIDSNSDGKGDRSEVIETTKGNGVAPSVVQYSTSDIGGNIIESGVYYLGNKVPNEFTYDYQGNKLTETFARELEKESSEVNNAYEYDYKGRVIKIIDIDEYYVLNEYDSVGNLVKLTDKINNKYSTGYSNEYDYDSIGRCTSVRTPFDYTTQLNYQVTKTDYDNVGNVIMEKQLVNEVNEAEDYAVTEYEYNSMNQLTVVKQIVDENQTNYTQYVFDEIGNVIRQYTGLSEKLTVTGLDNVIGLDMEFSVTKSHYDYRGLLEFRVDPLGKVESYKYNSNNVLQEKRDRNGNTTYYETDGLGRITMESVVANGVLYKNNLSYSLSGKILTSQNDSLVTSYTYDQMGRVDTETSTYETFVTTMDYEYDSNSNCEKKTVKKDGETIKVTDNTFDQFDRLKTVKENGVLQATYDYDENGNRKLLSIKNGIETSYQYNHASLLTRLENSDESGIVSSFDYTYRLDGNQISKRDNLNQSTTYSYDNLGRLKNEYSTDIGLVEYTYDDYNNRKTKESSVAHVNYEYDKNNRLVIEKTVESDEEVSYNYFYDHNGNQILKTSNVVSETPESATFESDLIVKGVDEGIILGEDSESIVSENTYDGFNRLKSVTQNNVEALYEYDIKGLRIKKTVDDKKTTFVLDGSNVIAEYESNQLKATYSFGTNLLAMDRDDVLSYYIFNGHGDVISLADSSGSITKSYVYDAFGIERDRDESDINPFRYAAEYFDQESNTYYLRARYYNPMIGRFTSADSYTGRHNDPLSLNLYTYCANNPITYIDPSGHIYIGGQKREPEINDGTSQEDLTLLQSFGNGFYDSAVTDKVVFFNSFTSHPFRTYFSSLGSYLKYNVGPQSLYYKFESVSDFIESSNNDKARVIGGYTEKVVEAVVLLSLSKYLSGKLSTKTNHVNSSDDLLNIAPGNQTPNGYTLTKHAAKTINDSTRFNGTFGLDMIDDFIMNPEIKVLDTKTNNINLFKMTDYSTSSYTRVTIPSDGGQRIISTGFDGINSVANKINNGRYIIID